MTLLLMGTAAPLLHRGWIAGAESMFNAPLRWIPRESPARADFSRFLTHFPSHEMVLVSWPGCTVDDPRLAELAEELLLRRQSRLAAGDRDYYSKVLTGYTMLQRLTAPPLSLSREAALERLEGVLVGPDGGTSCAVVALTDYGANRRAAAVDVICEAAQERLGLRRDELRLAGPPIDGIAIDQESLHSIRRFALPSALISLVLCVACLRSLWLTVPILAAGVFGQMLMVASVYYSGSSMNAVLIVLPPLVFVLTVSAGVHLVNYFYDALTSMEPGRAVGTAIRKAWSPCALAAITTAIGTVSLVVSDVWPVREFGALAAAGVLTTAVLLFSLAPGAMQVWLHWRSGRAARRRPESHQAKSLNAKDFGQPIIRVIWRHARAIRVVGVLLLVACGTGLVWLKTSIDVVSLLTDDNQAVRDFHWFEEHIGPLVPVEVVVHFGPECELDLLERLELVGAVQGRIERIRNVQGVMSALSYLPPPPLGGGVRKSAARTVYRHHVAEHQLAIIAAQYLAVAGTEQWWRISARIPGQSGFDYGGFLGRVRLEAEPVLWAARAAGHEDIDLTTTGVTAVVYQVQQALLKDLFYSYVTALVLIGCVMMIAMRSVMGGILAMIPNVFPTVVFFGTMGWLNHAIGIGTVMTASVTLGMAVDGTFHFLKWYRHEVRRGRPREEAAAYSFRHCGPAIAQTTLICASGLLIYSFSGFLPARHFAWVLLVLLLLAAAADLILLPSLLAGWLGRIIAHQEGRARAHDAPRGLGRSAAPVVANRIDAGVNSSRWRRRMRPVMGLFRNSKAEEPSSGSPVSWTTGEDGTSP